LNVDRLGQIATLAGVVGGGKSRAVTALSCVSMRRILQSHRYGNWLELF